MTRRTVLALFAKQPVWQERAPIPAPPRAGLIAAAYQGKLLLAGGSDWQADKKVLHARTDLFDPTTNQWAAGPDLPQPRCDAAAATLGKNVYAFGGVIDGKITPSVLRFDGTRWSEAGEIAPVMYAAAMATPRGILLFGGLSTFTDLSTATSGLALWSERRGPQPLAPFPGRPRVSTAFTFHQGHAYLFGGAHQPRGGALENLAEVWRYDLSRNQWQQLPDLPFVRRAWSAVPKGRRIWLIGGYRETFESGTFLYDPATHVVTSAAPLPHPLADVRFLRIGNRCINAGGETGFHIRAPWTLEAS